MENDKVSFYDLIISAAAEYIYMADENARRPLAASECAAALFNASTLRKIISPRSFNPAVVL